ncbi:MAG: carbohydrate kinase family protein [Acidobacteriota bacterium]
MELRKKDGRSGIACGGTWVVDRVKVIPAYPPENSTTDILGEAVGGGGCAFNVAIDLARFDSRLSVAAVGLIGEDPEGDFLVDQCRTCPNISLEQFRRTSEAKTSFTDVFSSRTGGGRTFFHLRGTNRLFGPESVRIEALTSAIFHLGYLAILDRLDAPDPQFGRVSARFLDSLQGAGLRTSVDLVSSNRPDFREVVLPTLSYTDLLIINDFEAERLTGVTLVCSPGPSLEALRTAAHRIFQGGVRELVVIHFAAGSYSLARSGEEILMPSLDVPPERIAGTTGAGDAFCAGILYGLHEGWDLQQALEFATCAGALCLLDVTTTGAIKSRTEVLKMKETFPFRRPGWE